MSDWKVERATVQDIEALTDLDRLVFPDHPLGIDNFVEAVCYSAWSIIIARVSSSDEIVAYCSVFPNHHKAETAQIGSLAVHPDWRNLKIATGLLAEAFAEIGAKNCLRVGLFVSPANVAAKALYQKCGFKPVELIQNLFGPGEDRLRMEKDIAN